MNMYKIIPFKPNISIPKMIAVIKHPVAPPNKLTAPIAAPVIGSSPIKLEISIPNVAPAINAGPILPPLNPIPRHSAVNIVLTKNIYHISLPSSDCFTRSVLFPQKRVVFNRIIAVIIINDPMIILKYSFFIF